MYIENLKVLRNHIIFSFLDDARKSGFNSTTSWGFEIKMHTDNAKNPRWALVHSVGDELDSDLIGKYIMIEPLMWTHGFELSDEKTYWSTIFEKVVLISDKEPDGTA